MSNARSPRDVCSITIGISGLISVPSSSGLLATGRPYLHAAPALLLLGCPEFLTRLRKLDRDAIDPADDLVERLPKAEIAAELLEASALAHGRDRGVRILAGLGCFLANQVLDLVVADLRVEL